MRWRGLGWRIDGEWRCGNCMLCSLPGLVTWGYKYVDILTRIYVNLFSITQENGLSGSRVNYGLHM